MAKQLTGAKDSPSEKSLSYPYYSFAKSLALAEAVKEYGGPRGETPKSVIAQAIKMSESSSTISQVLVSAKTFGIIDGSRSYSLTEYGQQYFFPNAETDIREAELAFFGSPGAFQLLIKRFDGSRIPQHEMLANILIREGNVSASWAGRAASIFITTAQELGVLEESGFLRYEASKHSLGSANPVVVTPGTAQLKLQPYAPTVLVQPKQEPVFGIVPSRGSEGTSPMAREAATVPLDVNVQTFTFTGAGGALRVQTPDPLPRAMWELLQNYVQQIEPAKTGEGGRP